MAVAGVMHQSPSGWDAVSKALESVAVRHAIVTLHVTLP